MGYIIGGILGIIIAIVLVIAGIKGGPIAIINRNTGQTGVMTDTPNWLLIIIGIVVAISSIAGIVAGATGH